MIVTEGLLNDVALASESLERVEGRYRLPGNCIYHHSDLSLKHPNDKENLPYTPREL